MDNENKLEELLEEMVNDYVQGVRSELSARWEGWSLDLANREMFEVIGALLARQVTLATQLAMAPSIWNGHIAPVILRTMVDTYITLAWIFGDPIDRSRKFVLYGLGQEKLEIEHLKSQIESSGDDINEHPIVEAKEAWLNSQRYDFLTEVNVGSWSSIGTREMAEESGSLDLYRYAYTPFSAATHSMWQHLSRYNLEICDNPLHRYHGIPTDPMIGVDIDYLYRAAKYVEKSFKLFDEKTEVKVEIPSAFEKLSQAIERLDDVERPEADEIA